MVVRVFLPDGIGIDVCKSARDKMPDVRCLVLSAFADAELVAAAHDADVKGYVLKHLKRHAIVDAIQPGARGRDGVGPRRRRLREAA
jgi:two-component system, NarL family, response regulator DevR